MPREFVRAYVIRASVVWLAIRVFVAGVGQTPWSVHALAMGAAGTVVIVLIDSEARHERRYLANLGVGRRSVMAICLGTVVVIESLIGVASSGLHVG